MCCVLRIVWGDKDWFLWMMGLNVRYFWLFLIFSSFVGCKRVGNLRGIKDELSFISIYAFFFIISIVDDVKFLEFCYISRKRVCYL